MAAKSAFETSNQEITELFADYLEGDGFRPAIAVSWQTLPAAARDALERSFEAFGYGAPTCTYITLTTIGPDVEGGDIVLDGQALFLLIEALDPLYVVAADKTAADLLDRAYRGQVTSTRAFGRPAAVFDDFPLLLETEGGKQKAWRALKALVA